MSQFEGMTWLNAPESAFLTSEGLTVVTANETDFWRGTFYGFWRDSGHFHHKTVSGDFTAEVTITGKFDTLYDQAGLMLRLSETHWLKAGIEYTDGQMHFSVVVTNDNSDWSQMPLEASGGRIRLRLTRHAEAIRVQYEDPASKKWKAARLAYLPKSESIELGIMCCSPQRQGFEVTFSDFTVTGPQRRDLHD